MKRVLRWLILGSALFFIGITLKNHWLEVSAIRLDAAAWAILTISTGVTLLAHIWAGWIWTWVLTELNQPVFSAQFIRVYLKTNIAKYLPGNIWHYYGRIVAAKNAEVPTGAATLSVLLEPLLMAAAALLVFVLFGSSLVVSQNNFWILVLQLLCLIVVLGAVHPLFLNPVINLLYELKNKKSKSQNPANLSLSLERYPLRPLLGELGFIGLRGIGFILTLFALSSFNFNQIPLLLGAFSFAWLLGLVVPGAPGGLGVFEATAIALLQNRFPAALVVSAIALYRLISILAETIGAALAWLDEQFTKN